MFYKWNKEFRKAGKKRLAGDTAREATSVEVTALRKENQRLKEIVAELLAACGGGLVIAGGVLLLLTGGKRGR